MRYMASTKTITDRLIRSSAQKPLSQFVTEHVEAGGDKFSLVAAIAIATGNAVTIDVRTSERWITLAMNGGLL